MMRGGTAVGIRNPLALGSTELNNTETETISRCTNDKLHCSERDYPIYYFTN